MAIGAAMCSECMMTELQHRGSLGRSLAQGVGPNCVLKSSSDGYGVPEANYATLVAFPISTST
jgi:hypothetical protein